MARLSTSRLFSVPNDCDTFVDGTRFIHKKTLKRVVKKKKIFWMGIKKNEFETDAAAESRTKKRYRGGGELNPKRRSRAKKRARAAEAEEHL
jgi:hypothetical protein